MGGRTAGGCGLVRAQLVLPSYSVEDSVALVLHFLNSHGLTSTATVLHKEVIARQLVPSPLAPGASHLHPQARDVVLIGGCAADALRVHYAAQVDGAAASVTTVCHQAFRAAPCEDGSRQVRLGRRDLEHAGRKRLIVALLGVCGVQMRPKPSWTSA
jgi:hypothetical protein